LPGFGGASHVRAVFLLPGAAARIFRKGLFGGVVQPAPPFCRHGRCLHFLGIEHAPHGPAIGIAPSAGFPIGIAEAILPDLTAGEADEKCIQKLHGETPSRATNTPYSHSRAGHAKPMARKSYPQDIVGPTPKNH